MKTTFSLLASFLFLASAQGQGTINLPPVPVTNGLTGVLADSSIYAALYYGPLGGSESALVMASGPSALVGGYAQFGNGIVVPLAPGATAELQVRAWSSPYTSYEMAVATGLPSVLVGRSVLLAAMLGGSPTPPPVPDPLAIPGLTLYPVPEPVPTVLAVGGGILFLCAFGLRRIRRHR